MPVVSISKTLSRTDAGESKTHQSGILIGVNDGRRLFPAPFGESKGGDAFECRDHTGRVWNLKFFHRAKPSESRITPLSQYIREYGIRSGDSVTICRPAKDGDPYTIEFETPDVEVRLEGEEDFLPGSEGGVQRVSVNKHERDPRNRKAAIRKHGVRCFGCRMEMAEVYGKIAEGFIHIHHVVPLSEMKGARPDIEDLVPLCPNCHSIVHLQKEPMSIPDLKNRIRQQQGKST